MYKYRYIIAIILAILIGTLICQVTYAGKCVDVALNYRRNNKHLYPIRIGIGRRSASRPRHMWAEIYKDGKWIVKDPLHINNDRYTAEELEYVVERYTE